jgi:hypothetical protein
MIDLFFGLKQRQVRNMEALWFGRRERRPSPYLPTLICDPLCVQWMGHQAVAAGARAFEFERDGGVSAVNDQDIKELYDKTPF